MKLQISETIKTLVVIMLFSFMALVSCGAKDKTPVSCHSIIKLRHIVTQYYLHSHDVPYGSGSGQQSVTAVPTQSDINSYWVVMPPYISDSEPNRNKETKNCLPGEPIKHGSVIRLQHVQTKRFLHSHNHKSPITNQQEVSCLEPLNTGDNWIVTLESEKKDEIWNKGDRIRLQHVDTKMYLHTHRHYYSNPIPGQQEVTGFGNKSDRQNIWAVEEGVFINQE